MFYGNGWTFLFLPDVYGREHYNDMLYPGEGTRFLLTGAPFHSMAATCALPMSIFGGGILCPGYRHRGMATSDISDYLRHATVTKAAMTPWMLEDIARKPDARWYIEKFESVLFGGGQSSFDLTSVHDHKIG